MGGEAETDRGSEEISLGSELEVDEGNEKGERDSSSESRKEIGGRVGSNGKVRCFLDVQIALHTHAAPPSSRIAAGTSLVQSKRASPPLKKAPSASFSFTSSEDEIPSDKGKQHQHYQQDRIFSQSPPLRRP